MKRRVAESEIDGLEEFGDIGELEIAEYVIFLLSFNTYARYVYEHKGEDYTDDLVRKGVMLVRTADRGVGEAAQGFFLENVAGAAPKKMVEKAFRLPSTSSEAVARRTMLLRTTLKRGGPATLRGLFKGQKALRDVKTAITASMMDDADAALDQLAAIPMRNPRLRRWIDDAAASAGSKTFQNPVSLAASEAADAAPEILSAQTTQAASPGTEDAKVATQARETAIARVQSDVTEASQRALAAAGVEDKPPTVSEVHGIVAATVAAAMAAPEIPANIPAAFINNGRPLDSEQMQAALTDGRVLVAAGAGAGKSTALVSRVAYLINDKQQDSGKILACCFNKKAQVQLEGKIKAKVGANNVRCATMHSLFLNFVVGNKSSKGLGTPEEQAQLKYPRLISDDGKCKPSAISQAIRNTWESCGKEAMLARYPWMPEEWFDGGPPKAKQAGLYMNQWRGNGVTLEQAKDQVASQNEAMAYIWYEMYLGLKGDLPGWRPACGNSKPYSNFMRKYRSGGEKLGDMEDMQAVFLSILQRDPEKRERVQNAFSHMLIDEAQDLNSQQHAIFEIMSQKVTPTNGKSIWMIGDDKQCLRDDTLVTMGDGSKRQLGDLKAGDRVLSLRNGLLVPQTVEAVWESSWKGGPCIATESGKRLAMSPTHKIWATAVGAQTKRSRAIVLTAHGHKGTHVRFEWSDPGVGDRVQRIGLPAQATGRLRRWFDNYREALVFAKELSEVTRAEVVEQLATDDALLRLMPASAVAVGMDVAVLSAAGVVELEEVVEVGQVEGRYLDMSVNDASNFFGGDILSSNCIYQFRGSRPELFGEFAKKEGWATRLIRTNYRCEPEIVEAANKLQTHNKNNLPMECNAVRSKGRGKASITVDTPPDSVGAAIATITNIVQEHKHGAALEKFAVLARTNNELNDFETSCIINEVPYTRKGGKGFMDAFESRALLGYLDLARGSSYESMRKSLAACIMTPNRGAFAGAEEIEKGIDEAISDVARRLRVGKEALDPRTLLEGNNATILADAIKRPYKAKIVASANGDVRKGEFIYKKKVEELAESLQELASDVRHIDQDIDAKPDQTSAELLTTILDGVSGSTSEWDPVERRPVVTTQTLREAISSTLKLWGGEEDDEEEDEDDRSEEEKAEALDVLEDGTLIDRDKQPASAYPAAGLGAVQFLFKMAVPNENDAVHGTDPSSAAGFLAKVERYRGLAEKLRIDPVKWEKTHGDKPIPAVTLSTVHKVKGAEWEDVTVLMPKGKFPMERKPKKGDPPPDPEKEEKLLEAERNLAYVAITRAQRNLKILCPETTAGGQRGGVSRFVTEAGLGIGENVVKDLGAEGVPDGASPPEIKTASELAGEDIEGLLAYYGYVGDFAYDRRAL